MEKELIEIYEKVKKAADIAENSPGEEDRCIGALELLKKFPVNYEVLVSTQVGKHLRQLTKHKSNQIKTWASEIVKIWKDVIVQETKKKINVDTVTSAKSEPENGVKNFQKKNSPKTEQKSEMKNPDTSPKSRIPSTIKTKELESHIDKKVKLEKPLSENEMKDSLRTNSLKFTKSQIHSNINVEEFESHVEKKVKLEKPSSEVPKLTSLVFCKDPLRDKVREILAEALKKVSTESKEEGLNKFDPYRVAVMVETSLFEKLGKSNGAQKHKYRSIMFNIKDANNPDFRRKVLTGHFNPRAISELTPEEMASDERQSQNNAIKQKAMFNSERAAAPKASTDQFRCGRCKKKETTYYQLQTRSADEPMTTFVTCVNCNNHWKFC